MSHSHLYQKVSGREDSAEQLLEKPTRRVSVSIKQFPTIDELGEGPVQTRSPPGKKSWLLSRRAGTILVGVLTAIIAALCAILLFSHGTKSMSEVSAPKSASEALTATPSSVALTLTTTSAAGMAMPTEEVKETIADIAGCGGNPTEARELGCVYDVMMQLWTPAHCYDKELAEKYLAANNWTWYADSNAERIMSDEEIALGEHSVVYVAQDYHVKHCIFAWERVVRALRRQGPLIQELISYDHVIHCRDHTLLPALEGIHFRGVVAPTGFTRCAQYDEWIKEIESQPEEVDHGHDRHD